MCLCVSQRALHTSMPFTVFCLSGLSAACLGLLLPETLNRPAAETLEELGSPGLGRVLESKVRHRWVFVGRFCFYSHSRQSSNIKPDGSVRQILFSRSCPCFLSVCSLCCMKMKAVHRPTNEAGGLVFIAQNRKRSR